MKFIVFFLFCFSVFSQTNLRKDMTILVDGKTRYFDIYIPSQLKTNPEIVIQLHGGTQNKDELYAKNGGASKYWKDIADREKFLLLIPNGTNVETGETIGDKLNWNDCRIHPNDVIADDVTFISKLIDWSVENYQVNSKKVFVTGVSNGGLMCYRLALEIPEKITAIAAFNANLYKESECKPASIAIPVMIVNGTKDKFMPFYGGKTKFRHEDALSSHETVDFWVKNNFPSSFIPQIDVTTYEEGIMKPIKLTVYNKGNVKNQIQYYEIKDSGHTMPGKKYVLSRFIQRIVGKQNKSIEGAEIAWDFFKKLSK